MVCQEFENTLIIVYAHNLKVKQNQNQFRKGVRKYEKSGTGSGGEKH